MKGKSPNSKKNGQGDVKGRERGARKEENEDSLDSVNLDFEDASSEKSTARRVDRACGTTK